MKRDAKPLWIEWLGTDCLVTVGFLTTSIHLTAANNTRSRAGDIYKAGGSLLPQSFILQHCNLGMTTTIRCW